MSNKFFPIRRLSGFLFFSVLLGFLFATCKKQGTTIPPALSEFASTGSTYFIQDTPTSVFHIPVGVTSISPVSRNITYKVVSSTASEGQQFGFAGTKGTVTIPADSAVGFIDIKGLFAGYSATPGRVDTLVLAITGGDVPIASFNTTFTLILTQYCPVVVADLLGNYNHCFDAYNGNDYGYYSVTITGTQTGPTSATLVMVNLLGAVIGPYAITDHAVNPGTTLLIDWSNPANFKVTIPAQGLYQDPTYGPAQIAGGGTFSSCDDTFSLNYSVSVSLGSFTGLDGSVIAR